MLASILVVTGTLEEVMDSELDQQCHCQAQRDTVLEHIISIFCINRAPPFPVNKRLGWTTIGKAATTPQDQPQALPGGSVLDNLICQECRAAPVHPLTAEALGILDAQAEISRNPLLLQQVCSYGSKRVKGRKTQIFFFILPNGKM